MKDIKVFIGQKIKVIRKSRGFTQEQLSELVGIEPQSLSYIETGKFAPSPDTLQKLSEVMNVKPYEFYYFDPVCEKEMEEEIIKAIKDKKILKAIYKFYKAIEFEK